MLEPGQVLDRYQVEALVAEGGMGVVYRVRHVALDSVHALKLLPVPRPRMVERLVREGRIQAAMRHPNVVPVTDVVLVQGQPALVMDYVDGPSLQGLLDERRLEPAEIEGLFRGILAGVGEAHRRGLVHRDLKPSNVLLARDADGAWVPRVSDFGIARILEDAPGDTRTGATLGTPGYMAPEQFQSAAAPSPRADVYALGCVLYHLLCGRPPFHGSLFEVMTAASQGRWADPAELGVLLPPPMRALLTRCLSVNPLDRPADANELARAWPGLSGVEPAAVPLRVESATTQPFGVEAVVAGVSGGAPTMVPERHVIPAAPPVRSAAPPPEAGPPPAPLPRRAPWLLAAGLGVVVTAAVLWPSAPVPTADVAATAEPPAAQPSPGAGQAAAAAVGDENQDAGPGAPPDTKRLPSPAPAVAPPTGEPGRKTASDTSAAAPPTDRPESASGRGAPSAVGSTEPPRSAPSPAAAPTPAESTPPPASPAAAAAPAQGRLRISGAPAGSLRLHLDGKALPGARFDGAVAVGPHSVRLEAEGRSVESTVEVPADGTALVCYDFERDVDCAR